MFKRTRLRDDERFTWSTSLAVLSMTTFASRSPRLSEPIHFNDRLSAIEDCLRTIDKYCDLVVDH